MRAPYQITTAISGLALAFAAPALAQSTAPAPAQSPAQQSPAAQGPEAQGPEAQGPAAPDAQNPAAAAAASQTFTDAELQKFGQIASRLSQIQAAPDVDDAQKQQQMAAAVEQGGMTVERFNQITEAARNDPALQQKINAAQQAGSADSPN